MEPGDGLVFDSDERAAVDAQIGNKNQSNQDLLEGLAERGLFVSGVAEALSDQHALFATVAEGLLRAAEARYANEEFAAAATTCIKAILVAGLLPRGERDGIAEAWLLVAKIHASAGRFRTAFDLLTQAKNATSDDPLVSSPPDPKDAGGFFDLTGMWREAVESLERDIAMHRRPKPYFYLVPAWEWYDD